MAKISAHIVYNDEILLDIRQNIVSANVGCLDRGNATDFVDNYIFANTGRISFTDFERKVLPIYEQHLIDKCDVRIFVSANYGDERLKVATFDIDDCSYNYETLLVTLELKDKLLSWQTQKCSPDDSEMLSFYTPTLFEIIDELPVLPSFKGNAGDDIDKVTVGCFYEPPSSNIKVWDLLREIGEASMTRCFSDENGLPCMGSPYKTTMGIPIVIRPHNIKSVVNRVIKGKSKIPHASLSLLKRTRKFDHIIGTTTKKRMVDTVILGEDEVLDGISIALGLDDRELIVVSRDGSDVELKYTIETNETIFSLADFTSSPSGAGEASGRYLRAYSRREDQPSQTGFFPCKIMSIDDNILNKDVFTVDSNILPDRHGATIHLGALPLYVINGESISLFTDLSFKIRGTSFIDEGNKSYSYNTGEGADNSVVELPTNNLMQVGNSYGYEPYAERILELTRVLYSAGLECVELECDFGDYSYYNSDSLAYSQSLPYANQIGFKKYDIVVPFIVRNGVEVPLSSLPDGSPKQFSVIGIKYNYNGVLRQNLVLQEVPQQYPSQSVLSKATIISTSGYGIITIYFSPNMTWREWVNSADGQLYGAYCDGEISIRLNIGGVDHELYVGSIDEEIISDSEYFASLY